jgi:hypothetical protein
MENIPHDVQVYILKFLISFDNIVFKENEISNIYELSTNYNSRYKVAYYGKQRLFNGKYLLSKIDKPNGNHRYYFTKEIVHLNCFDCKYTYKMINEKLPNIQHISSLSIASVSGKINGSCSGRCFGSMDIISKYSSFYVGNEKNLFNVFVIYLCL